MFSKLKTCYIYHGYTIIIRQTKEKRYVYDMCFQPCVLNCSYHSPTFRWCYYITHIIKNQERNIYMMCHSLQKHNNFSIMIDIICLSCQIVNHFFMEIIGSNYFRIVNKIVFMFNCAFR